MLVANLLEWDRVSGPGSILPEIRAVKGTYVQDRGRVGRRDGRVAVQDPVEGAHGPRCRGPGMDRKPMIETSTIDVRHDAGTGNKCVNQYVMQATLGKGSYGKVKLAIDETTGAQVAIKIVNKARLKKKRTFGRFGVIDPLSGIRQEVAVMKKLDHVNVVKLLEVIDNPDAEKLYLGSMQSVHAAPSASG